MRWWCGLRTSRCTRSLAPSGLRSRSFRSIRADWSLDVDAVAAAMRPNTKAIVVNFPHSPTGAQLEPEQFARLVAIAELHGVHLFSDEVYRLLEHSAPRLPTAAESSPQGVSLGVMSKAFGMAGVRIGWIATRDQSLRARLASLKDYTTICSSAPSELLSLMALRACDRIVERTNQIVCANLAVLDDFFRRRPEQFSWVRPRAGTVAFPRILDRDVDDFAARLIEREGVLILPASQFGYPGNFFRLGFGRRDMPEALERLDRFVRRPSSGTRLARRAGREPHPVHRRNVRRQHRFLCSRPARSAAP